MIARARERIMHRARPEKASLSQISLLHDDPDSIRWFECEFECFEQNTEQIIALKQTAFKTNLTGFGKATRLATAETKTDFHLWL